MGIARFFHNVGAFFGRIFGADAVKKVEDLLINNILPIAMEAVVKAELLVGASGKAKQAEAFRRIKSELGVAGNNIKTSLINLAIEIAVAKMNGVFAGN